MNRNRGTTLPFFVLLILAARPGYSQDATLEIVESRAIYTSQGKEITVERFEPRAEGKFPIVLVLHGAGGMTIGGPMFRESARLLARRGYVAHVVHYFDLTRTEIAGLPAMRANFPSWLRAIADGITSASKQPNVDPKRVGLLGYSLGAYLSLSLAAFDPRVSAVVEYFGGLPPEIARELKSLPAVLILHGAADKIVPVSEANELERLLAEKNLDFEKKVYPGQGHGFLGDEGQDATNRTIAFLEKHLRTSEPPKTQRETLKPFEPSTLEPQKSDPRPN
jgi:carboxymethylenebutenolidase